MEWLIDTNILSELRRPRPEGKVIAFISSRPLHDLYISVVTIAELGFGIQRLPNEIRRAELEEWLIREIRQEVRVHVLGTGLADRGYCASPRLAGRHP